MAAIFIRLWLFKGLRLKWQIRSYIFKIRGKKVKIENHHQRKKNKLQKTKI